MMTRGNRMFGRTGGFVALLLLGAATGQAQSTQPAAAAGASAARGAAVKPSQPGMALEHAVRFKSTALSGNEIDFPTDYKGKVVLLTFWGTWCPKCRAEVKFWREAYQQFHGDGLEIIGLSSDKFHRPPNTSAQVNEFLSQNGIEWEVLYEDYTKFSGAYDVRSVPSSFLIDADTGKILASNYELRKQKLASTIEKSLAAKKAAREAGQKGAGANTGERSGSAATAAPEQGAGEAPSVEQPRSSRPILEGNGG